MNDHALGMIRFTLGLSVMLALGCTKSAPAPVEPAAETTPDYPPKKPLTPKELFPHVRIDKYQRVVEIDGTVPIDTHDPRAPTVFLETICCTSDTREHESLVVTSAKPSHLHTALLLLAFEPGSPGRFQWNDDQMTVVPPMGDGVRVTLVTRDQDGNEIEHDPSSWIVSADTGERFEGEWVFAGSRMVEHEGAEFYDADGAGVVVGLHSFGSEVIALRDMISPEADVEAPVWIANGAAIPEVGTPVVIRFSVR